MQSAYWDGPGGEHWSKFHERHDELLGGGFGLAAIAWAAPRPGEHFVDIGCGAGATTVEIGRRVGDDGSVVGVDVSGPLLRIARRPTGPAVR